MKKLIVVLIVSLAAGYYWGYGEGSRGEDNVATRVLGKFGVAKVQRAQQQREKGLRDASAP
jgi:hypothetical protein